MGIEPSLRESTETFLTSASVEDEELKSTTISDEHQHYEDSEITEVSVKSK